MNSLNKVRIEIGKIKIADLRRFVKAEIQPRLSQEWVCLQGTSFVRFGGYSIQKLIFSEFYRQPQYRIYYSVQSLAIPVIHEDDIGIGATLRERSAKNFLGLFQKQPREVWFNWNTRLEDVNYIMELIAEQVEPPINLPLTANRVFDYLNKHHLKKENKNPIILWTAGILLGELEKYDEARQFLFDAVGLYTDGQKEIKALVETNKVSEEKYLRWVMQLEQVQEALKALGDADTFRKYCKKVASESIEILKIPDYQAHRKPHRSRRRQPRHPDRL